MDDHLAYCERLVRAADKDRFLATLFAPADRRGPLFALYAFNVEVARARERVSTPLAGEMRLQWWREALSEPGGLDAGANPVAAAMRDAIARLDLPVAMLLDLIEARRFDIYDDPMPSLEAFEAYALRTSSHLMALAAMILGDRDPAVADIARPAGIAYATAGLLRMFPIHAARRQIYLPLDLLERHGLDAEGIIERRRSAALAAALAEMRGFGHSHLAEFLRRCRDLPRVSAPAFLPVALVPLYLDRLARAPDPFRIVEVAQWRRQWTLWRAAHRA